MTTYTITERIDEDRWTRWVLVALAAFIVTTLIDLASTLYVLHRLPGAEGDPLANWAMGQAGGVLVLAVPVIVAPVLVFLALRVLPLSWRLVTPALTLTLGIAALAHGVTDILNAGTDLQVLSGHGPVITTYLSAGTQ